MHPLLLFTLFFIPGIKSSYVRHPELDVLRTNDLSHDIISYPDENLERQNTAVGKPKFYKKIDEGFKGHQKLRYDRHHRPNFEKHLIGNEELMSTKDLVPSHERVDHNLQLQDYHHSTNYAPTPSPYYSGEIKDLLKKDKYHDKKYYKKKENHKFLDKNHEKSEYFKSHKKNKYHKGKYPELNSKHIENGKRYSSREDSAEKKELTFAPNLSHEHQNEKYIKATREFLMKHSSINNERKLRAERVKRGMDSEDSDESFHGGEYDDSTDNGENKSEGSLENIEKLLIAHLYDGSVQNSYPYSDVINVDIKNKGEGDEKIPVVEEIITKTRAYVSCNDGDNVVGCEIRKPSENTNNLNEAEHVRQSVAEHEAAKSADDNEAQNEYDAWLKALEDEIMNSGIEVQLHHH